MRTIQHGEVVLPGVGVWTPAARLLEGDASRMGKFQESPERLIVHIHKIMDMHGLLSNAIVSRVQDASLVFHREYCFQSLKWELLRAEFDPKKLKLFRINMELDALEKLTLRSMVRGLCGAEIHSCRDYDLPKVMEAGEIVGEEDWLWHHGETVAVMSLHLPWVEEQILDRSPRSIVIDCDNQFLVPSILTEGRAEGIENVTLLNVTTTSTLFLTFLESVKLPSLRQFHLTTREPISWGRAVKEWFKTKSHLHNAQFILN